MTVTRVDQHPSRLGDVDGLPIGSWCVYVHQMPCSDQPFRCRVMACCLLRRLTLTYTSDDLHQRLSQPWLTHYNARLSFFAFSSDCGSLAYQLHLRIIPL